MTPILSPLGAAIEELYAAPGVTAITTRIRPTEPSAGDAKGAGAYLPFIVLAVLDPPWAPGTATSSVTLALRCYAATFPAAEALYLACAAVFHRRGPRVAASGLPIFGSVVEGGPTLGKDPGTSQPYAYGVFRLNVSTQPIT
jgi:hypothetical protein